MQRRISFFFFLSAKGYLLGARLKNSKYKKSALGGRLISMDYFLSLHFSLF
jgi:hypothetical protein